MLSCRPVRHRGVAGSLHVFVTTWCTIVYHKYLLVGSLSMLFSSPRFSLLSSCPSFHRGTSASRCRFLSSCCRGSMMLCRALHTVDRVTIQAKMFTYVKGTYSWKVKTLHRETSYKFYYESCRFAFFSFSFFSISSRLYPFSRLSLLKSISSQTYLSSHLSILKSIYLLNSIYLLIYLFSTLPLSSISFLKSIFFSSHLSLFFFSLLSILIHISSLFLFSMTMTVIISSVSSLCALSARARSIQLSKKTCVRRVPLEIKWFLYVRWRWTNVHVC